jgi:hypothetical protein
MSAQECRFFPRTQTGNDIWYSGCFLCRRRVDMQKLMENRAKFFSRQWNFFQPEQNETDLKIAGAGSLRWLLAITTTRCMVNNFFEKYSLPKFFLSIRKLPQSAIEIFLAGAKFFVSVTKKNRVWNRRMGQVAVITGG